MRWGYRPSSREQLCTLELGQVGKAASMFSSFVAFPEDAIFSALRGPTKLLRPKQERKIKNCSVLVLRAQQARGDPEHLRGPR